MQLYISNPNNPDNYFYFSLDDLRYWRGINVDNIDDNNITDAFLEFKSEIVELFITLRVLDSGIRPVLVKNKLRNTDFFTNPFDKNKNKKASMDIEELIYDLAYDIIERVIEEGAISLEQRMAWYQIIDNRNVCMNDIPNIEVQQN